MGFSGLVFVIEAGSQRSLEGGFPCQHHLKDWHKKTELRYLRACLTIVREAQLYATGMGQ